MTAILGQLIGGGIIQTVGKVIDDLHTSDAEVRAADLEELKEGNKLLLAQTDINKVEAASASLFVAGWRPFIGWICGGSLGLYYIPKAVMLTAMWVYAAYRVVAAWNGVGVMPALPAYPDFGVADLLGLVMSMLGMAGLRHREVVAGKAREALAPTAAGAGRPSSVSPQSQEAGQ